MELYLVILFSQHMGTLKQLFFVISNQNNTQISTSICTFYVPTRIMALLCHIPMAFITKEQNIQSKI